MLVHGSCPNKVGKRYRLLLKRRLGGETVVSDKDIGCHVKGSADTEKVVEAAAGGNVGVQTLDGAWASVNVMPPGGEPVEVGSRYLRLGIEGPNIAIAQIVGQNQDNVWCFPAVAGTPTWHPTPKAGTKHARAMEAAVRIMRSAV